MSQEAKQKLSRLQKLKISAKTKRRGTHKGGRMASKFGSSLEFSDFRVYQPGDDVRQIDWNVFGRTQKHYIKRFLDEQELTITIFLDSTQSMQAIDSKWQRAKEIAASLSYITLSNEDRLSFTPVSENKQDSINRKGTIYGKRVFFEILQISKQSTSGAYTESIQKNNLKRNQVSILITDGLEELNRFEQLFRVLGAAKQEVKFIQLLSRQEITPDYTGDVKLIDSELQTFVNVSMNERILENYQKRLTNHNHELEALCKSFGFSYLLTVDDHDLNQFFFHECTTRRVVELLR